jgi:putative flippase GtrA
MNDATTNAIYTTSDTRSGDPAASGLGVLAVRFAAIGIVSTVAYVVLYGFLRRVLDPFTANSVALMVTAVSNNAANRRLSFRITTRTRRARDHLEGLMVFGIAYAITTCSLSALRLGDPSAGRHLELAVLVGANLVATAVRFVLLRNWVFNPRRRGQGRSRPAETISSHG